MTVTSDRIKSLRLKKNMSQSELATKLGIGRSNMGHIENGRVEPTKESIVLLSEIFGVTTDYLLGRTNIKTLDERMQAGKSLVNFAINDDPKQYEALSDFMKLDTDNLELIHNVIKKILLTQ